MSSCENCAWRIQYDMKLKDLESILERFPPKHGDFGLVYGKQEVEDWLLEAKELIKKEKNRKYK